MIKKGKLDPETAAALLGTSVEKLSPEKKKARRGDEMPAEQQVALSSQKSFDELPPSQKNKPKAGQPGLRVHTHMHVYIACR